MTRSKRAPVQVRTRLNVDWLEDRVVPAVTFKFDYSLDTAGFFADPARRIVLEKAGLDLASRITSTPAGITPSADKHWTASLNHPTFGTDLELKDVTVPEGSLVVFVGARNLPNLQAGEGGPGAGAVETVSNREFFDTVSKRISSGANIWGGSLTFDKNTDWYFGLETKSRFSTSTDFYSVAVHELGHVLGVGTSTEFTKLAKSGRFTGSVSTGIFGASVPLASDSGHIAQGTKSGSEVVSMQPRLEGRRVTFSQLDYALLVDIGWNVSGLPAPTPATTTTTDTSLSSAFEDLLEAFDPSSAPPELPTGSTNLSARRMTVVSGPKSGTVDVKQIGLDGKLAELTGPFRPFGKFGGPVRGTTADMNGDGVGDIVLGTGPGGNSLIRVLDGKTFKDLAPQFTAFESFTGGVFLSSGDIDQDGRDEIIITPDQGGGPRVRIMGLRGGSIQTTVDFFGIEDTSFRGGARASMGDINGDGTPELIVSAGFGGGPRVAIFDGLSLLTTERRKLMPDFFVFEQGLRNGVYVGVGDIDGDNKGELVLGAGPGGGPRLKILSGAKLASQGSETALATPFSDFFAGESEQRGGVRVAIKDLNGDGKADVLTGSGIGNEVRVYRASPDFKSAEITTAFAGSDLDGIYVG